LEDFMEYRMLGATGAVVSTLALGTMTFGTESDEMAAHAQLDRYVEAGGNLIDTADVYSAGESEHIVGRWLAARDGAREQIVLASKGRFPTGDGRNDVGLSRQHLAAALDASLRRLGVDTIDLYQLHSFDPLTPLEETLRFLDDAGGPERSTMSACRTSPAGSCSGPSTSPSSAGWPAR
jgi:aryl-alcohol dehydrogenase (NADP+)